MMNLQRYFHGRAIVFKTRKETLSCHSYVVHLILIYSIQYHQYTRFIAESDCSKHFISEGNVDRAEWAAWSWICLPYPSSRPWSQLLAARSARSFRFAKTSPSRLKKVRSTAENRPTSIQDRLHELSGLRPLCEVLHIQQIRSLLAV